MNLNWISLLCLVVAVVLGIKKKLNIGLVATAVAFILGKAGGISDSDIIKGFSSFLFMSLLGVMYLFCIAQANGAMELFAKKTVALAGKNTKLIPIVIFIVSIIISAIGPGALAALIIMSVFAISLAKETGISPLLMSLMAFLGTNIGGVSPVASNGIIVITKSAEQGINNVSPGIMIAQFFTSTLIALILYFMLGGHKINSESPFKKDELPKYTKNQQLTLLGLVAMVVIVFVTKWNVGLVSIVVAIILLMLKTANEKEVISIISWGTLILIAGFGILMGVIDKLGGIALLSKLMSSVMNETIAPAVMSVTASVMGIFSSTSGVVLPTLTSTISSIVEAVGGNLDPRVMVLAMTAGAHISGMSPFTGGAVILSSFATVMKPTEEENTKFYLNLIKATLFATVIGGLVALTPIYSLI